MSTRVLKMLLTSFAAVFLAAAQACACVQMSSGMNSGQHTPQADHSLHIESSADSSGMNMSQDENDAHNCTHCIDGDLYALAAPSGIGIAASPASQQPVAVLPKTYMQTRARMAPAALAGLRWLDPPRILSTPVSLKTRLLN